jgi:twitching motility protein PilI
MVDKDAPMNATASEPAPVPQSQPAATTQRSWLAVEAAGQGFLFPLGEAGEISAMVPLTPLPHAQPWFVGVANLRGHLHGVIDLGAFLGLEAVAASRDSAMLVAFNASFDTNAALRVDRLAGLRSESQFTLAHQPSAAAPPFVGHSWRDAAGRLWQEIRLASLVRHEAFLRINA